MVVFYVAFLTGTGMIFLQILNLFGDMRESDLLKFFGNKNHFCRIRDGWNEEGCVHPITSDMLPNGNAVGLKVPRLLEGLVNALGATTVGFTFVT